jgi:polyisoprenoid-binding protein YceI
MGRTHGERRSDPVSQGSILRGTGVVRQEAVVNHNIPWVVLLLTNLTSLPARSADNLPIDPSHTAVLFSWNHRGLSHPVARLEKLAGAVILDQTDLTKSSVTVTMPLEGLRTGSIELDRRLLGKDFFDVARYPVLSFKSTRVEIAGDGSHLRISGDLSVHGVTRAVMLDAHINKIIHASAADKPAAGFDAQASLRRSDFGLGRYVPMVSDEITVHMTLEASED